MQFSPIMKDRKQITIQECLEVMETIKGHKPTSNISKKLELHETQKKVFMVCSKQVLRPNYEFI
jgi:hypothetical protein